MTRYFRIGILFTLIGAVILLLIPPLLKLNHVVYLGYNEGWMTYHIQDAMHGSLYAHALTPTNYPPLYFYIVGFLSNVFGEPLFIGRYLSIIALGILGFEIFYIVRLYTKKLFYSVFSGIFFIGIIASVGAASVGLNDPQLFAMAIAISGLILYLKSKRLFLTALILVISIFIKHNLIVLPLAISIDLFFSSKKLFVKWIFIFVSIGLFAMLLAQYLTGNHFLSSILSSREYSVAMLLQLLIPTLLKLCVVFALGIFFSYKSFRTNTRLFGIYFFAGCALGVFFSGGSGTDINQFYDAFISVSILIGIFIDKKNAVIGTILLLLLTVTIVGSVIVKAKDHVFALSVSHEEMITQQDIQFIQSQNGPVLCESILLCYLAHKPFLYDPYSVNEMVMTRKMPEQMILTPIENKEYSMIELYHPLPDTYFKHLSYTALIRRGRFTENFYRALGNNYHLVKSSGNGAFYLPN